MPGLTASPVRPGRLVGLDVARCLALFGMVATHVLQERTPEGDLAFGQWLAGGRSSALFAVLAGVSLALMTGGREPVHGSERARLSLGHRGAGAAGRPARAGPRRPGQRAGGDPHLLRRAVPARAAVRRPRRPGARAAGRGVGAGRAGAVAPAPSRAAGARASRARRSASWPTRGSWRPSCCSPGTTRRSRGSPTCSPGWRSAARTCATRGCWPWVGIGGLALAVAATWISNALTDPALREQFAGGMYGTTPADGDWSWLLFVSPHSGTPFDFAQTIGSAFAVIAGCLLLERVLPEAGRGVPRRALRCRRDDAQPVQPARAAAHPGRVAGR